jgi:hypothetical protein
VFVGVAPRNGIGEVRGGSCRSGVAAGVVRRTCEAPVPGIRSKRPLASTSPHPTLIAVLFMDASPWRWGDISSNARKMTVCFGEIRKVYTLMQQTVGHAGRKRCVRQASVGFLWVREHLFGSPLIPCLTVNRCFNGAESQAADAGLLISRNFRQISAFF